MAEFEGNLNLNDETFEENEPIEYTELEDEALEGVAGGKYGGRQSFMRCDSCGRETGGWQGDYRDQGPFECPICGSISLRCFAIK